MTGLGPVTAAVPDPPPVESVRTSLGPVSVRRTAPRGGPQEPAILIHGLGGSALDWVDLADALARVLDCVSLDLPGFGHSPPPRAADYSMQAQARVVAAAVDALFPSMRVHVFGNSMGGAVAVHLVAQRPDLVRSLCLISPALPAPRPRVSNIHVPAMAIPGVGEFMRDRFTDLTAGRRVQATVDLCFADPARLAPSRRRQMEAEVRLRDGQPWARQAYMSSLRSLLATFVDRGPTRPWALAEQIEAPTLVVYGGRDKLVDSAGAHRAMTTFRNPQVVVLRDAGHVAQMEHPALVARIWRERLLVTPA